MRPMRSPVALAFVLLPVLLAMLVGCPSEDGEGGGPIITATRKPTNVAASTIPSGLGGGILTGSSTPSASPAATSSASPSPSPSASTATTPPTAPPLTAVTSVVASPTFTVLYPAPQSPQLGLGYPSSVQLSAFAVRGDGAHGGVLWLDRSGGQLTVSSSGLVSASSATAPGIYYVRAQSLDDPKQSRDAVIQVLSTGALEAIVQ